MFSPHGVSKFKDAYKSALESLEGRSPCDSSIVLHNSQFHSLTCGLFRHDDFPFASVSSLNNQTFSSASLSLPFQDTRELVKKYTM